MTQWNLIVSDETDRIVQTHLAKAGGKRGDLSQFVDEAVRQKIFRQTVKEMKEWNANRDQQELMSLIDEAVDRIRAPRS